jgi:hypothetical protein
MDARRPGCSSLHVDARRERGPIAPALAAHAARVREALKLALFQPLRRRPRLFDAAKRIARHVGHQRVAVAEDPPDHADRGAGVGGEGAEAAV